MPHGVGNKSEQSKLGIWTKTRKYNQLTNSSSAAQESNRHYMFPKHESVPIEPSGPPLCCTLTSLGRSLLLPTDAGFGRVLRHNQKHFCWDIYSATVLSQSRLQGSEWRPSGAFRHETLPFSHYWKQRNCVPPQWGAVKFQQVGKKKNKQ